MTTNRFPHLFRVLAMLIAGRFSALLMMGAAVSIGLMLASPAEATDCTMSSSATSINFGNLNPASLSSALVGSPISGSVTATVHIDCPPNPKDTKTNYGFYLQYRATSIANDANQTWDLTYGTFATGLSGIGIRVTSNGYTLDPNPNTWLTAHQQGNWYGLFAAQTPYNPPPDPAKPTVGPHFTQDVILTFQLIRLPGTLVTGPLKPTLMSLTAHDVSGNVNNGSWVTYTLSGTVKPPTCSVTTGAPPVTLPTVSTSTFGADGTTAGETGFTIKMDCTDVAGKTVYVSMAGANGTTANSNRLNIATGTGNATGIKLQILHNHQPIIFGTETATVTPGQTNQWSAGKATDITANGGIPMTARYIRDTATNPLKAGKVTGQATFTMAYQ